MSVASRKKADEEIEVILLLCGEADIDVKFFNTGYQVRLQKDGIIIDLYPQSNRYCDVRKGKWGEYDSDYIEEFIEVMFEL